jgi:hypothetical protein
MPEIFIFCCIAVLILVATALAVYLVLWCTQEHRKNKGD